MNDTGKERHMSIFKEIPKNAPVKPLRLEVFFAEIFWRQGPHILVCQVVLLRALNRRTMCAQNFNCQYFNISNVLFLSYTVHLHFKIARFLLFLYYVERHSIPVGQHFCVQEVIALWLNIPLKYHFMNLNTVLRQQY